MAIVQPGRTLIYAPGAQFRSAVSESLIQGLAGLNNFISLYQHSEKQFFLNGPYSTLTMPQTAVDGLVVFEFNAYIFDVWMFNIVNGSAGTTELDLKLSTGSGGAFTSIFTTTPKITSAAGNNAYVGKPIVYNANGVATADPLYATPAGCTKPVFVGGAQTYTVLKQQAIRLDILQAQTGGQNCGLLVHYYPF